MLHTIRMHYGYKDEYIMEKPLLWVQNAHELCLMHEHDSRLSLARTILHEYACAMAGDKGGYMKSYTELAFENLKQRDDQEEEIRVMKPETMPSWGLGYRKKKPVIKSDVEKN